MKSELLKKILLEIGFIEEIKLREVKKGAPNLKALFSLSSKLD